MQQQILPQFVAEKPENLIEFKNLDDLCSYVQYLTAEGVFERYKSGNSGLLDAHLGKTSLIFDKYVLCSIPNVQLEFLFESMGVFNYNAEFDGFKRCFCTNEDVISESIVPVIYGEHFNPFKRFQSCISSASRTCRKVLDLAGLEIKNISELDPHDNIFLDITCTFPFEIDVMLLDVGNRDSLIERLNQCRRRFFKKFEKIYTYGDSGQAMGCSSSLHLWSSQIPLLPNAHVHNFIPGFSYRRNIVRVPELLDVDPDLLDSVCFVSYPSGHGHNLKKKFIVDSDKYQQLRLRLSGQLKEQLGFSPIVWHGSKFPLDSDLIKQIWTKIVKREFKELEFSASVFDVHIEYVFHYEKARILHKLQYKCRPPVLDLDLFFKKVDGIIPNFNKVNLEIVSDYLYRELEIAVRCSNNNDINRFESYVHKLEYISKNYSSSDIYSWLQFLCSWVTDTKVHGFWKHIKRYLLDPDFDILVEGHICPICGGDFASVDAVKFCMVDSVIVRHRSYFMVYNFDGG